MIYHEQGWPTDRTFPFEGKTCHVHFFIHWAENEKGHVVVTSLEPQFEVHPLVWAAFLAWAEAQFIDWAEDISEVIDDARDAERAAWFTNF